MYSGVEKTIRNTSGNSGGRRIENKGADEITNGSNAIGEKDSGKRPRSGSLDGHPPNSRDNPINVDDFLSMFEPAILNEYVCVISFLSCST
jgi:hypothetical protein